MDQELEKMKEQILESNETRWRVDLTRLCEEEPVKSWVVQPCQIPITPHIQYPLRPRNTLSEEAGSLERSLREAHERERYLERIIQSQNNQLNEPNVENTLYTLGRIDVYNQNELKIHHSNRLERLKKELGLLSRQKEKLDVITHHLTRPESATEIEEREELIRKLKLNELRLAVKDVELAALKEKQSDSSSPPPTLAHLSVLADRLLKSQPIKREMSDPSDIATSKRVKASWSQKQDELLFEAIQKIGTEDWHKISTLLPQHTAYECHQRWEILSNNPRRHPSIASLVD
ncbi:hypothetical protein BY458DRAFT_546225 [Sporodiniella umbellata]|nr:hypothetical protein BY458DRAFT_546225 [Sporodiniella umbellata]